MRNIIKELNGRFVEIESCHKIARLIFPFTLEDASADTYRILVLFVAALFVGTDSGLLAFYTGYSHEFVSEVYANMVRCGLWNVSGCRYQWDNELDAFEAVFAAMGLMERHCGKLVFTDEVRAYVASQERRRSCPRTQTISRKSHGI